MAIAESPKTQEELLQEEINNLKEQLENLKKQKQFDEPVNETKRLYDSYIHAGFTEKQAFEFTKIILTNVSINCY